MAERKRTPTKAERAQAAETQRNLQTVTAGTTIRIVEPPKTAKRRASKPKVITLVGQTDDVLIGQASGFANFLRDYAVVGLAVGFIVGQQANGVVKQLVTSFLDPVFQMLFGQNLSGRFTTIHHGNLPVKLYWGAFVYNLIEFFFVLISIYLIIKLFRLDKLKKIEEKK